VSTRVVLTLDVDWAPDSMVDAVAARLVAAGAPATWFVTHESPALERLRERPDLFELGIHPNFRAGSSHGETPAAVLEHVMALVPEAVSSRAHGVEQSGDLLHELVRRTPVRIDSTTFLPDLPDAPLVTQRTPHGDLLRVPFTWSDDYEPLRARPDWGWERVLAEPGLKVVLFHPTRVESQPGPAAALEGLLERIAGGVPALRLRDLEAS
jgi:hypothetical protein